MTEKRIFLGMSDFYPGKRGVLVQMDIRKPNFEYAGNLTSRCSSIELL